MRVALVGTGGIARAHVTALSQMHDRADPPVDVVAGCDVDAHRVEAFTAEHDIPTGSTDLAEMLEQVRPEVVHVCTPPGLHADQAIACLRAGAHVVCEKPPVLTLAELDAVQAAERATGRWYTTIFQHRFGSAGRHVRDLIGRGALGAPRIAICHTLWFRPDAYYEVPWRGNWDVEGGGPTLGHGVHQIDLLAHLLGDWTEVTATATRLARHILTEDVSMAHVAFDSGALGSVVTSVLSPREESYLRFDFDDATVEVSHLYGYTDADWTITPATHVDDAAASDWALPGPDLRSGHLAQLELVYPALAAGERPPGDSDSARRTMELVTGIYASAFTDVPVRRDDIADTGHPFHSSLTGGVAAPVPGRSGPLHQAPLHQAPLHQGAARTGDADGGPG